MDNYTNNTSTEYEEYLRKKEERRRKKRMIILRRRIIVGIIGLILLITLLFGIVKGIMGIVHLISGNGKVEQRIDEEIIPPDAAPTVTPSPTPIKPQLLADNEDTRGGNIMGTEVFEGYRVDTQGAPYIVAEDTQMQSLYAALIDGKTGKLLVQREATTRIPPASMTKIMTLLVASEHITEEDLDKEVVISADDIYKAYKKGLSSVGYKEGDVATVRELFYGTMLQSGADAAVALARFVAGSEDEFVVLMNDKLAELGLSDTTHFVNCAGEYNDDHYSTCVDMAMILKATIENDFCFEVMNVRKYDVNLPSAENGVKTLSNLFLRRIEDKETHGEVFCAKTGFVNQSGNCAASYYVSNEGEPYFCVTVNAHSAWRCIYDHVYIYDNLVNHS